MNNTVDAVKVESPEEIRKKYISHEASIRLIGTLYWFGAALSPLTIFVGWNAEKRVSVQFYLTAAFILVMAVVSIYVGSWLRKLNKRAIVPATMISILGLFGFPVGTLISIYCLWLLHSANGKYVFSNEYSEIISQTPNVKYKTSIIVWAFVGILGLYIVFGLIAAIVASIAKH